MIISIFLLTVRGQCHEIQHSLVDLNTSQLFQSDQLKVEKRGGSHQLVCLPILVPFLFSCSTLVSFTEGFAGCLKTPLKKLFQFKIGKVKPAAEV